MTEKTYRKLEEDWGGIRIVLEFPGQSENTDTMKQEVRMLLADALQEHLKKHFGPGKEHCSGSSEKFSVGGKGEEL